VRGVINFCEEYEGPVEKYEELGIQQLHLPTTDHFEPSLDDLVVRDLGLGPICALGYTSIISHLAL
jgi:hypothetical protein